MVASKTPLPGSARGDLDLDAEWSVVKKHSTDPDTSGWPRLTIISVQQMLTAYKVDLTKCAFTVEFDMVRHGVWLFLADPSKVGPNAAKKINFKKRGANQARFDFNVMTGLFKGMSTEKHNVRVEVWHKLDMHPEHDRPHFWLFAPIVHVESMGQLKGGRLIE